MELSITVQTLQVFVSSISLTETFWLTKHFVSLLGITEM